MRLQQRGVHPLGDRHRLRLAGVLHQQHELVATHARHEVCFAARRADLVPDELDRAVAGGVAERAVVELEVVHVEQHQRAVVS